MNHFIKSHFARKAAEASAQASASNIGSLPSASAANSAGASTNMAEISRTLDPLLNRLSDGERLTIAEENVANRLQRLCDMYPESRIPEDLPPWHYNAATLTIVRLAADCAEAVYKHKSNMASPRVPLSEDDYVDICEMRASQSGAYKATAIKIHRPSKTLVVAVRGTKKTSPIDWITNANGAPEDATSFLPGIPGIKAHSGFLYAAKNMYDPIISATKKCQAEFSRVVLTGHSAGGAVAALLFLKLRLTNSLDVPLHCVTFAAPPVIDPRYVEQSLPALNSVPEGVESRFLAFVACGDIVVRADRPYIRKILEIYGASDSTSSPTPQIQFEEVELYNPGNLVMLFDNNPDGEEDIFEAVQVGGVIGNFLWGNAKVHAMKWYCEMLEGLQQDSTPSIGIPLAMPSASPHQDSI